MSARPARVLRVGDIVRIGNGRMRWEVEGLGGDARYILLRSLRTRRPNFVRSDRLTWFETGEPVDHQPSRHPDDVTPLPLSARRALPLRAVRIPAADLPTDLSSALVEGDTETVVLLADDLTDDEVCTVMADFLVDYLQGR